MSHGGRPTFVFSRMNFVHFRRPTEFNIRIDMRKWTVSLQSFHAGEFTTTKPRKRMNALKRFGNYIFTVKHSNERRRSQMLFNGTNHAYAELVL
jgi:hypothetical protein